MADAKSNVNPVRRQFVLDRPVGQVIRESQQPRVFHRSNSVLPTLRGDVKGALIAAPHAGPSAPGYPDDKLNYSLPSLLFQIGQFRAMYEEMTRKRNEITVNLLVCAFGILKATDAEEAAASAVST